MATTIHADTTSSLAAQATALRNSEAEKVLRMATFVEGGTSKSTTVIRTAEGAISPFRTSLKESVTSLQASTSSQLTGIASTLQDLDVQGSQTLTETCESLQTGAKTVSSLESEQKTGLHSIQTSISRLVDQQIQVDQSTNRTPKKRSFEYPKGWRRTRTHDEIVQSLRLSALDTMDVDCDDLGEGETPAAETPVIPTPTSTTQEEPSSENIPAAKDTKRSLLPRVASTTGIPRPVLNTKNT